MIITLVDGYFSLIYLDKSRPSITGIVISVITSSGCTDSITEIASLPFSAVPVSIKPASSQGVFSLIASLVNISSSTRTTLYILSPKMLNYDNKGRMQMHSPHYYIMFCFAFYPYYDIGRNAARVYPYYDIGRNATRVYPYYGLLHASHSRNPTTLVEKTSSFLPPCTYVHDKT